MITLTWTTTRTILYTSMTPKTSLYFEVLAETSNVDKVLKNIQKYGQNVFKTSNKIKISTKNNYQVRSRNLRKCFNDILVFHRTPNKKVPGIFTISFKKSEYGQFGPEIYNSNFFTKSISYSGQQDCYNFINEMPLKYFSEKSDEEIYCCKYLCSNDQQFEENSDSDGSFINIASNRIDDHPEFVASSNIVVPKYLVEAVEVKTKLVKTTTK